MRKFKHDFDAYEYLDTSEIKSIYDSFSSDIKPVFEDDELYYLGENPTILKRYFGDSAGTPDNKIPISYARKIINTITGYMYKPDSITYTVDDGSEPEFTLMFKDNDEPIKTSRLGRLTSTYGVAYELHYKDKKDMESVESKFVPIDPRELIPVYDYSIEPKLKAAIRFYRKGKIITFEVYYDKVVKEYVWEDGAKTDLTQRQEWFHFFPSIPVIVFKNNEEEISDFEPIKRLIDAYDVLMSDSMNEFDRFAFAYLLLTQNVEEEELKKIKKLRVFTNLEDTAAVQFLTKEIPFGFIQNMIDNIRFEIHNQSHVPNFTDIKTGEQISGVAIDRLLYDFEFIAATKEAYFRKGLEDRFKLLGYDDVYITMKRNKPTDKASDAALYNQYYNKGISTETLISEFAPFVDNPAEEIADAQKEQSGMVETLPEMIPDEDETEQEPEETNPEDE